mgnify:CR=1 FL=1
MAGSIGVKTAAMSLDEAVARVQAMHDAAKRVNGDVMVLCHGGPSATPEDAQYVDTPTSFVEQKELWDVPFLFMLLCMTFGAEWFWRKRKGLA